MFKQCPHLFLEPESFGQVHDNSFRYLCCKETITHTEHVHTYTYGEQSCLLLQLKDMFNYTAFRAL